VLTARRNARAYGANSEAARAQWLLTKLKPPTRPGGGLPRSVSWDAQQGLLVLAPAKAAFTDDGERHPSSDETWARNLAIASSQAAGGYIGASVYASFSLAKDGLMPSGRPLIDNLDELRSKSETGWAAGSNIAGLITAVLWSAGGSKIFQALEASGFIAAVKRFSEALHGRLSEMRDAASAVVGAIGSFLGAVGGVAGDFITSLAGLVSNTFSGLADATSAFPSDDPATEAPPDPVPAAPEDPEHPKPPGDEDFPNPDSDNPYTGGGNPFVSFTCSVGTGLGAFVSRVAAEEDGFACGAPRLGPGITVADPGYLRSVPFMQSVLRRQSVQFTDPRRDDADIVGGISALQPVIGNGGAIDPSPAERAALTQLGGLLLQLGR
jgi:hypothetical protein